jgi:hypothetical protein
MLMKCLSYKTLIAGFLSFLMMVDTVPADAFPDIQAPPFGISLPAQLGQVTDAWSAVPDRRSSKPDYILIQNLHCNRSVQLAISKILNRLKSAGNLPERIAVEGLVGPYDVTSMQQVPDWKARLKAADYLVSQGEMNGTMHFVVSQGKGGLYGIETADLYDSTIETYRRSYAARSRLGDELATLEAALARLKAGPDGAPNAAILTEDVQAIRKLIDQRLTPEEVHRTVTQAVYAVDHLKSVLPKDSATKLLDPVSAAVDFYALALLRDNALFEHSLELRKMDHQATTVLVAGGFHTPGLTQRLKAQGLSYVVISPSVRRYTAIDEHLYVERMLGHHITVEEASEGKDCASMNMVEPPLAQDLPKLFSVYASGSELSSSSLLPGASHYGEEGKGTIVTILILAGVLTVAAFLFPDVSNFLRSLSWFEWFLIVGVGAGVYRYLWLHLTEAGELHRFIKRQEKRYLQPTEEKRDMSAEIDRDHIRTVQRFEEATKQFAGYFVKKYGISLHEALFIVEAIFKNMVKKKIAESAGYGTDQQDHVEFCLHIVLFPDPARMSEVLQELEEGRAVKELGKWKGGELHGISFREWLESQTDWKVIEIKRQLGLLPPLEKQKGVALTETLALAAAALTSAGLTVPNIWPWLAAIPWWGWVCFAFFIRLIWDIFSPVQRVMGAAGLESGQLPKEIRGWIRRFGAKPLIKIARVSGTKANDVFAYGLPAVREHIKNLQELKDYGAAIAEIARASGENAFYVFRYSFPAVKEHIRNLQDLKAYGAALTEIARAGGQNANYVFAYGLPAVREHIKNLQELKDYGAAFVEIARASGENARDVFQYGIPAVRGLIGQYGIEPFVEIARVGGMNTAAIFRYGLPALPPSADLLNKSATLKTLHRIHDHLSGPFTWTLPAGIYDEYEYTAETDRGETKRGIEFLIAALEQVDFSKFSRFGPEGEQPATIEELTPNGLVRYFVLKYKLGFEFSPETQGTLEAYIAKENKDLDGFAREAAGQQSFQERLAELVSLMPLQDLELWRLTDLFLKTKGDGANDLSNKRAKENAASRVGFNLTEMALIVLAVVGAIAAAPFVWPVLAGVSIWVWGIGLVAVGTVAAIYAGVSLYQQYQAKKVLADAKEAEIKSLAGRLRERLPKIDLSIPAIRNIFIIPPWMKPAVAKQVAQETDAIINAAA